MSKTIITKNRGSYVQKLDFSEERFKKFFDEIVADTVDNDSFTDEEIESLLTEVVESVKSQKTVEANRLFDYMIRASNNRISAHTPYFTKFSAATMRRRLYKEASKNRGFDYHKGYGDYYSLVKMMVEQGIYHQTLIDKYTEDELREIGKLIVPERDKYFDYSGLQILHSVFLKKDESGNEAKLYELPQERFLSSVAYLMQDEDEDKRLGFIKEGYEKLSNHYIGLATPTLKNAGSPDGTLSSCHIVTVDDDLENIFNSNTQMARFSSQGAGLGILLGELRAAGSWIRGVKGNATGIVHPARLQSVVAEYVNQGGVRKGGIAIYLPVWHGDIFDFLELRLKTGSQEFRAHSINTAVNLPDEFMRRLENRELFTVFDPYEIKTKLGFNLNDMYDKKKLLDGEIPNKEDHEFTYHYRFAEASDELELKRTVKATSIYQGIFNSRKTGGTPYMYWSDTSARMNPNGHVGMPKGSNLCWAQHLHTEMYVE